MFSRHKVFTRLLQRNQSSYYQAWKKNPLPFWAGISMIGAIHFINVQRKKNQEIQEALESGKLIRIENDQSLKVKLYNSLPLESMSKYAGTISHKKLPEWFRPLILGLYCKLFNVNMAEALNSDLKSYQSLNEFFRRKLKPEVRPIDVDAELVSPCDGKVFGCGPISDTDNVEQVKGMTYSLKEFLGFKPENPQNLYQIVMYLAPGDYHCFHSPASWTVDQRKHFSGRLLSVRPSVATWMPKLFAVNERVAYFGTWQDSKFFSYTAVGATNVGSILIDMDPDLVTNTDNVVGKCNDKYWTRPCPVEKGQHFGKFYFTFRFFFSFSRFLLQENSILVQQWF